METHEHAADAAKIPAYLSADGGDARLVASYEGREVWAVRRKHGHDRRTADVRAGDPGPHFYWTPVIQTEPGREKAMAFYAAGWKLRFDDCDTCVRAITDRLANRDSLEEFLRSNMETQ